MAHVTGRPPYHPGDLLKLYLYGYLNQVRSSRSLAKEAVRNIEVLWLVGRVQPAFKTIADFRKDHGPAIVGVARAFTAFCREQGLFGAALLAIDAKIAAYLAAMDEADGAEPAEEPAAVDVAAALAMSGGRDAHPAQDLAERSESRIRY